MNENVAAVEAWSYLHGLGCIRTVYDVPHETGIMHHVLIVQRGTIVGHGHHEFDDVANAIALIRAVQVAKPRDWIT